MRAIVFLGLLVPIMGFQVELDHSAALNHIETAQVRILEDKITKFLECLRDILKKGDADLGFPSFDPLTIPTINIDLDALDLDGLSGYINVNDIKVSGIPNWKLDKLKISITIIPIGSKVIVKINWPNGELSSSYDANATIFDHTIIGSGDVTGSLNTLSFEFKSQVVLPPKIKSANFKVALGSSSLNIPNLSIDGTDISGSINDVVSNLPTIIKNNHHYIDDVLQKVIIPAINAILRNTLHSTYSDIPIIGKCLP